MLMFKSLSDLREYLTTRREFAKRQGQGTRGKAEYSDHVKGQLYAFDEAIRALDAFLEAQEPIPSPLEDSGTGIELEKSKEEMGEENTEFARIRNPPREPE